MFVGALSEWFRIVVTIKNERYVNMSLKDLDRNLINTFNTINALVTIVVDNDILCNIYAPTYCDAKYWDVGLIFPNTSDFVLFNTMTNSFPTRMQFFPQFIHFSQFINHALSGSNFYQLFGKSVDSLIL